MLSAFCVYRAADFLGKSEVVLRILSGIWQLRILFGTKRASNRVIKCLVCPVNLKNSIIFVPIEVDNYDYTGRNIAVPAL